MTFLSDILMSSDNKERTDTENFVFQLSVD